MFLNPYMLAWTVAAAVPLLVHLLSRSRYRSVEWGAMMFLGSLNSSQQHYSRLKQWLLLTIRSVMIALLAVALARPVLTGKYSALVPTAGLTTGGQASVIIILDDSASMGYTQNGKTRLDEARAVTLQILSGLQRGDQAALLLAGLPADQSQITLSGDLQAIASRVGDLSPGTADADFADALNRAMAELDHASGPDREVYIISDRQALSWRRVLDTSFSDAWTARKSAGTLPRITLFPVGGYQSDNIAVEGVRLTEPPLIRDQSAEVQIRVKNYGPSPAVAVPLSLWTGPRTLGETTITVPPGATRQAKITVRFPEAGSFVISAAVKSAGLTYDDRFDYAADVSDPLRVLLISGDDADVRSSTTASLRTALLSNTSTDRRGGDIVAITEASSTQWTTEPLAHFQAVVLADVSYLSADQIRDIEQFVYDGGGVWFVPGPRVRADEFNELMYRAGSGIFPASLATPTLPDAPVELSVPNIDRQHPVFHFLGDAPGPKITVQRIFPSVPRVPDAHVVAGCSSGLPLLIETSAGRGHVLMLTTGFDDAWNDLARNPQMLPFAQSVVRYLTASSAETRNLWANQPIMTTIHGLVDDRPPTVQFLPGGRREPAIVHRFDDRTEIQFYRTDLPGTYRLRYRSGGNEKSINFVVAASRTESDLTPLTDVQRKTLHQHVGLDWIEPSPATVAGAVDHQRGGREIWIDLLAGVLLLSVVEIGLARWWAQNPGR